MLKRGRDRAILEQVCDVVSHWSQFAAQAGVPRVQRDQVARMHRLQWT
jgi:hypothetical protein